RRQLTIYDREAVGRLERTLHLPGRRFWGRLGGRREARLQICAGERVSQLLAEPLTREFTDPAPLSREERAAQGSILREHCEQGRDFVRLLALEQDPCPTQCPGDARRAVRDDRHIEGHRLDERYSEALVLAQAKEGIGPAIPSE